MSRSTRKSPNATDRQTTTMRATQTGGKGVDDKASQALRGIAGKGGNDAMAAKLADAATVRDLLARFACQRLEEMHKVQLVEQDQMGKEREWFKGVAKGQPGYHLPDPTRWHLAADLYKKAVLTMCNGNLGQGAELMKKAEEAERTAYDSMPDFVRWEVGHLKDHAQTAPDEQAHVAMSAACPTSSVPKELRFADLILNIGDEMEKTPPINRRKGNAWWLDEEEDEEDGAEA
ncbi:MAG: hypothetical protein H6742_00165 [Alphaproteobacteria bacterium]|nr:hypothetical protein [Alphaproteobacteria bacterium]